MTKDDIKIKYIIGTYRDLPGYPSQEDFLYKVNKWYYLDGGKENIHGYMKIPDIGKVIISNKTIESILEVKNTEKVLNDMLSKGVIKNHKSTAHTTYYTIETDYHSKHIK